MELDWGIITFIMTSILGTIGWVWKYFEGKISDLKIALTEKEKRQNEFDIRLDKIETCYNDSKVDIAKINKDIEYIKIEVIKISQNLEKKLR